MFRKQFLILSFLVSLVASAQAQGWPIIHPDETFFFQRIASDGTSDGLPAYAVQVDSMSVNAEDSTFYLNRHVEACPTCESDACNSLFLNEQAGPFGYSVLRDLEGFYFQGNDTLFIPHQVSVGASWNAAPELVGTLDSLSTFDIFGVLDSVKYLRIGEQSLRWSKQFGLLEFPFHAYAQSHELTGINGRDLGLYPPDFEEIFNWELGDVFYYQGHSGSSFGYFDEEVRRQVLEKQEEGDSIMYSIEEVRRSSHYEYDLNSQQVFISQSAWKDTITESYHPSDWVAASYLPNQAIGERHVTGFEEGSIDQAPAPQFIWAYFDVYGFEMDGFNDGDLRSTQVFLDEFGNPILGVAAQSPFTFYYGDNSISPQAGDLLSMFNADSLCVVDYSDQPYNPFVFARGLGIVSSNPQADLVIARFDLLGASTSTVSFGEIPACEELLFINVAENEKQPAIRAYPNTANEFLRIDIINLASNGTLSISCFDLAGKKMLVDFYRKGDAVIIDVSRLSSGTYTCVLEQDGQPIFREKMLIVH